jgi:hypothetical protein
MVERMGSSDIAVDCADAEAAVAAALSGSGSEALRACLAQMGSTAQDAARSSVTYQVWSEWLQVNNAG